MELTREALNEWVDAYIKAEESEETIHENHQLFWAINKFFELESDHPEMCLKATLGIIHREPSQQVFSV